MTEGVERLFPDPESVAAASAAAVDSTSAAGSTPIAAESAPRLVVFDFDGTLAEQRGGWGLLYRLFGLETEGTERTDAYWRGDVTFAKWCEGNVADWRRRGVTKAHLERAANAIKLTRGADSLLRGLSADGIPFGVLSSGVVDLTARLDAYDPAFVVSNEILYENGEPVGVRPHVGPNDKGEILAELCATTGVPRERVAYVGDSHSDVEAFEEAGTAVLFDPDDRIDDAHYDLVEYCQERRDLSKLESLLRSAPEGEGNSNP